MLFPKQTATKSHEVLYCMKSYIAAQNFKHNCTYLRGIQYIFHRLRGLVKLSKEDKNTLATANYDHRQKLMYYF